MSDAERAELLTSRNDTSESVSKPSKETRAFLACCANPGKLNWRLYFSFVHELLIVTVRVVVRMVLQHRSAKIWESGFGAWRK
jgi:hypothetical protein